MLGKTEAIKATTVLQLRKLISKFKSLLNNIKFKYAPGRTSNKASHQGKCSSNSGKNVMARQSRAIIRDVNVIARFIIFISLYLLALIYILTHTTLRKP